MSAPTLLLSWLNWLVPKSANQVVLHSVPDVDDNVRLVTAGLLGARTRYRVTVLVDGDFFTAPGTLVTCAKGSVRGWWRYARSSLVFTTHGIFGGHRSPPRQCVVNLWHGEPLGKPVGLWDGRRPAYADVSVAMSEVGKAFRCAEFGMRPDQVLVVGSPRNDVLLQDNRVACRSLLPAGSETVLLWLPTYRVSARGEERTDGVSYDSGLPVTGEQLFALNEALRRSNIQVLYKPHPLSDGTLNEGLDRIRAITDDDLNRAGVSLYELLSVTDGLVTDVSSVWVDYLLVDRPIYFFFPDLKEYEESRGIHLRPYDVWAPGPVSSTVDEFVEHLLADSSERRRWAQRRRDDLQRFHAYADDRSTERLLSHFVDTT